VAACKWCSYYVKQLLDPADTSKYCRSQLPNPQSLFNSSLDEAGYHKYLQDAKSGSKCECVKQMLNTFTSLNTAYNVSDPLITNMTTSSVVECPASSSGSLLRPRAHFEMNVLLIQVVVWIMIGM
jgi:hypothetical protein